jgi:hypothetical protein
MWRGMKCKVWVYVKCECENVKYDVRKYEMWNEM